MSMFICATIFRSYRHLKIVANHLAEEVQFYPKFQKQSLWRCAVRLEQLQAMEVEMHLQAINMSLGRNRSEMRRSELQRSHLKGICLHLPCEAQLPSPLQPLPPMKMDLHRSGNRSPETRGPGTLPRILLQDRDPQRPPSVDELGIIIIVILLLLILIFESLSQSIIIILFPFTIPVVTSEHRGGRLLCGCQELTHDGRWLLQILLTYELEWRLSRAQVWGIRLFVLSCSRSGS